MSSVGRSGVRYEKDVSNTVGPLRHEQAEVVTEVSECCRIAMEYPQIGLGPLLFHGPRDQTISNLVVNR